MPRGPPWGGGGANIPVGPPPCKFIKIFTPALDSMRQQPSRSPQMWSLSLCTSLLNCLQHIIWMVKIFGTTQDTSIVRLVYRMAWVSRQQSMQNHIWTWGISIHEMNCVVEEHTKDHPMSSPALQKMPGSDKIFSKLGTVDAVWQHSGISAPLEQQIHSYINQDHFTPPYFNGERYKINLTWKNTIHTHMCIAERTPPPMPSMWTSHYGQQQLHNSLVQSTPPAFKYFFDLWLTIPLPSILSTLLTI
jgi:hypothetical protein